MSSGSPRSQCPQVNSTLRDRSDCTEDRLVAFPSTAVCGQALPSGCFLGLGRTQRPLIRVLFTRVQYYIGDLWDPDLENYPFDSFPRLAPGGLSIGLPTSLSATLSHIILTTNP